MSIIIRQFNGRTVKVHTRYVYCMYVYVDPIDIYCVCTLCTIHIARVRCCPILTRNDDKESNEVQLFRGEKTHTGISTYAYSDKSCKTHEEITNRILNSKIDLNYKLFKYLTLNLRERSPSDSSVM